MENLDPVDYFTEEGIEKARREFRSKLRELLEHFNATIEYSCDPDSDLANVWDQKLEVFGRVGTSFNYVSLLKVAHTLLGARDIEEGELT